MNELVKYSLTLERWADIGIGIGVGFVGLSSLSLSLSLSFWTGSCAARVTRNIYMYQEMID